MDARAGPLHAKRHYANKTGFEKEGRKHFIGIERPNYVRRAIGENALAGVDLVRLDQPSNNSHCEAEREPEALQLATDRHPGSQPEDIQEDNKSGDANGVSRPRDVEADR
jgi:hypothetical protein